MLKKFTTYILVLVCALSCICCSKKPDTGEAIVKLPAFCKKFGDVYRIGLSDIGREINFRNCVTVDENTTWVLSKKEDGSNPIETFKITPSSQNSNFTYYVVCSDRIGISNSYKLQFETEGYTRHLYYYDFDETEVNNYYKSAYSKWLNTPSLNPNVYYGISDMMHRRFWIDITDAGSFGKNHPDFGTKTKFYKKKDGTSFDAENKIHPGTHPNKSGYKFVRWTKVVEPLGLSTYYIESAGEDIEHLTVYKYSIWIPEYEKI